MSVVQTCRQCFTILHSADREWGGVAPRRAPPSVYADLELRDGRYRLIKHLGDGSIGGVWLARDLHLDDDVALKFLNPDLLENPQARSRMEAEAKIVRKVKHANIIGLHEFFAIDRTLVMVLEFAPNGDLDRAIEAGPMSWKKTRRIMLQICGPTCRYGRAWSTRSDPRMSY